MMRAKFWHKLEVTKLLEVTVRSYKMKPTVTPKIKMAITIKTLKMNTVMNKMEPLVIDRVNEKGSLTKPETRSQVRKTNHYAKSAGANVFY